MIEDLLSRLDKVKQAHPNQWVACCPAHSDKKPSLAVKLCDNGKILIKCWTGCAINDILDAVGVDMKSLFPENNNDYSPQKRQYFSAAQVLKSLVHETTVVSILAGDIARGDEIDNARLSLAIERINDATTYCRS